MNSKRAYLVDCLRSYEAKLAEADRTGLVPGTNAKIRPWERRQILLRIKEAQYLLAEHDAGR